MLDRNWRPDSMQATEDIMIILPHDGHIDAGDAERLMVVYQNLSEEWTGHFANATYHKESCRFKRDSAFQLAWLRSEAKSDKGREVDAKQDPTVRLGEVNLAEATAALKLAELRYDGSVRGYHACKRICENAREERKFL